MFWTSHHIEDTAACHDVNAKQDSQHRHQSRLLIPPTFRPVLFSSRVTNLRRDHQAPQATSTPFSINPTNKSSNVSRAYLSPRPHLAPRVKARKNETSRTACEDHMPCCDPWRRLPNAADFSVVVVAKLLPLPPPPLADRGPRRQRAGGSSLGVGPAIGRGAGRVQGGA